MKLGTQTGSMTNHLYSRMVIGQPEPKVGMGGTILMWTDRHACTITRVFIKGKSKNSEGTLYIAVQEDRAKRIDNNGFSEDQKYEYSPNPNGIVRYYKREKDGRWSYVYLNEETGRFKKESGGGSFRLGVRDTYHDHSF